MRGNVFGVFISTNKSLLNKEIEGKEQSRLSACNLKNLVIPSTTELQSGVGKLVGVKQWQKTQS